MKQARCGAAGDSAGEPEKHPYLEAVKSLSSDQICLDLSYKLINYLPITYCDAVQFLELIYLQGNNLTELPSAFFATFPVLRRLDLRFNKLKSLPASVGNHKCLEVLLLQDNHIEALPRELGSAPRLRRLQLFGNPLTWPAADVLSRRSDAILSFLRTSADEETATEELVNEHSTKAIVDDADQTEAKGEELEENLAKISHQQCFLNQPPIIYQRLPKQRKKATECAKGKRIFEEQLAHQTERQSLREQKVTTRQRVPGHALVILHGKRFPLGYSKRCCSFTEAKICKTLIQQLWLDQLKNILQSQDHALQKLKDREVLLKWRSEAKQMQQQLCQKNWPGLQPPYDFDSAYLKMITRDGLHKFQGESLEKKGHSKPTSFTIKVFDFQEKMNQLIASFDRMKSSAPLDESCSTEPGKRCQLLAEEMEKIRKLQQAIQALRLSV